MPPERPAVTTPLRPRSVVPVSLGDLAGRLRGPRHEVSRPDVQVSGISLSSSTVLPGDLYAALPGTRTHGARFASAAVQKGAVALLTDRAGADLSADCGLPVLLIDDPRRVLGQIAACVYGDPAAALTLIGVTGTQGKTTTTQLISAALGASGRRPAVIGTLGTRIGDRPVPSALTTPEATDLHALLAVMREEGVDVCAMEVSSHAVVMGRVDGVVFDVAAFTNFGRDHLDFHATLEDYFNAKAELFTPQRARRALLNADDPEVRRLLSKPSVPTSTFSPGGSAGATWRVSDVHGASSGSRFRIEGPLGIDVTTSLPIPGDFNVANALCAVACVGEIAADRSLVEAAAGALATVEAVAGRMEAVERGQDFRVLVDYAHKPDALAATLRAVRRMTSGRITVVLGAGGERDPGKRPLMGQLAVALADIVVVTDDNPRGEDAAAIRAAILTGAESASARSDGGGGGKVVEIGDRRAAIASALTGARAGDTVLIAGKGHESGQQVGAVTLPFDDRAVAGEILDRLATESES